MLFSQRLVRQLSFMLFTILELFLASCVPSQVSETSSIAVFSSTGQPSATIAESAQSPEIRLNMISVESASRIEEIRSLSGHQDRVGALTFLPDGRLASGSWDGTILLWDPMSGTAIGALEGHQDGVCEVVAFDDGNLASGSWDHTLKIWDMDTAQELLDFEGSNVICALGLSPVDRYVAFSVIDDSIYLLDLDSADVSRNMHEGSGLLFDLAFTPDGGSYISVGRNGEVVRWDISSNEIINSFIGESGDVHSVDVSPDGKVVAAGGTSMTVTLWDMETGDLIHSLRNGQGIYDVAFSPDGSILAAAGTESSVKLWDATTGRLLITLVHGDEVMTVAFSGDSTLLATGGYDKDVILWGVPALP